MKLIVDTNILFTVFWQGSFSRKIIFDQDIHLYAPEYALEEINIHASEIMKKTGISLSKFKEYKTDVAIAVEFIALSEYKEFLSKASKLVNDDVDFVALALQLNIPLWSQDNGLKKQKKVKVYNTKELIEEFKAEINL